MPTVSSTVRMAGHRVGGGEPVGERGRSVAEERFDELDKRRLRSDFLSQVREVCRLHLAKDPLTRDAEIEELEEVDGVRFDHLVVSYHRGPWLKRFAGRSLRGFGRIRGRRPLPVGCL